MSETTKKDLWELQVKRVKDQALRKLKAINVLFYDQPKTYVYFFKRERK